MAGVSRRRFLEDSLFAAAAMAASSCAGGPAGVPSWLRNKPAAASDRLRVAVVGVNGRGMAHVRDFAKRNDAEVVAICDVDESAFGQGPRPVDEGRPGKAPALRAGPAQAAGGQVDRRRLDRHAEPLARAGRRSGRCRPARTCTSRSRSATTCTRAGVMVEAARKHDRIVQTGTQSRSNPGMRQAIEYVQLGQARQGQAGPRPVLQAPREHRQGGRPPARPRRPSTTTCGWGRPRRAPTCPGRSCTTTGTGTGTTATATSATRASTRWTRPAGAWARPRCRRRWSASAAGSATTTTARRANTQVCVFDYGDAQLIFEVRGLHDRRPAGGQGRQHLLRHRGLRGQPQLHQRHHLRPEGARR